ncbi:MAG: hypothetical protein E7551_00195 [Ruminococcaceae bacterium]|nr:hypothetical protein [Oscillospiraceae bacterium]
MNKNPLLKGGMYRKAILLVMLVGIVMSIFMVPVSAQRISQDPYDTYTYWSAPGNKNAVSSAAMYEYETTITGADLGLTAFATPTDVFVDDAGFIYFTDKGNNRIVIMNSDYTLKKVLTSVNYKGEELTFNTPCSVFVTKKGELYIADQGNERVVICDINGVGLNVLYLPEDDVIPENFIYKPEKIVVDSEGYIYVLSNGSYYGAVLYDNNLEFSGFYGANSVSGSILDIFTRIYELYIMSDAQHETKEQTLPYCFTDISVDADNFIYTATAPSQTNSTNTGQLKKLSPGGINVLKNKTTTNVTSAESFNFSDGLGQQYPNMQGYYSWKTSYITSMDVDSYGYMYGLCGTYGHVFIYDQECNQLSVFGGGFGEGGQQGTFRKPINIQVDDKTEKVYVVDELLNSLTVFKPTEYGSLVKKAQALTNAGDYVEAEKYWNEALTFDRNSQLAYRGLSRAALVKEEYEKTLEYAELGFDQDTYASAFTFVRNDYLAENFVWMFILAIAVVGGLIFFFVYMKKKEKKLIKNPAVSTMFNCVVHPFEGSQQVRYYNKGSAKLATLLLVIYFITTVCSEIYYGFMYRMIDKSNYSAGFSFIRTFGIVLLWTVVNWGLTTLFQGKGNMKQVYIVTCYALIPQIISSVLTTILSNVLVPEEALVITAISTVCLALTAIMLCVGIMTVHEFGFFKFLIMSAVIILGMLVCVFVIMMVFVLLQQLFTFAGTIYKEVSYR